MAHTVKVWKSGNGLAVTVPKSAQEIQGISKGDYVEVSFRKLDKVHQKGEEKPSTSTLITPKTKVDEPKEKTSPSRSFRKRSKLRIGGSLNEVREHKETE